MMKRVTTEEIARRAGALAKVLEGEPTLVGRSLCELSLLIEALACEMERRHPVPTARRRK